MASTATTFISNINAAFPLPAQDNDSQGFRDNYANIKNGLTSLANEITAIQAAGVFKTTTNNFQQNIIQNAQFQSSGYKVVNKTVGVIGGDQTVNYAEGNYQIWKITSATNLSFANFPDTSTNGAVRSTIQLELYTENTQTVAVTLVASSTTSILLDTNANAVVQNPISLTTSSPVIYEVSCNNSPNGEPEKLYVRFVGGPFEA